MTRSPPSTRWITLAMLSAACSGAVSPARTVALHPLSEVPLDTSPKEPPRLMPAEAYIRSYLSLFGGLAPLAVQARARGNTGAQLFDTWDDYLAALGLPDYRADIPRGAQTNALMLAAFERLGVALCDRAVETDLRARPAVAPAQRLIFAFDLPPGDGANLPPAAFDPRFDVLHRRFLAYPTSAAPEGRVDRFRALYNSVAARHLGAPRPSFGPAEAGWAAVCYGLVRHPEFQFY